MIRIKISVLLGEHKMTRKRLAELTNIRPNTIGNMYNETIKRIDIDVLNRICKTLNCKIEDVLEYIPDKVTTEEQENKNE